MPKRKIKLVSFKVHTPNLLKEIADSGLPITAGVLFVPLNSFRILLGKVSERAIELDDPIMNDLMCQLTLYDQVDLESKDYQKGLSEKIHEIAEEYKKQNQTI